MLMEKKALSFEEIEAQTALELPNREMLALVNIIVFDVLNNNNVNVQVPIGVAANVCGLSVAAVLAAAGTGPVDCSSSTLQQLPVAFQR
jgi:hypothetical protein